MIKSYCYLVGNGIHFDAAKIDIYFDNPKLFSVFFVKT